MNFLNSDKSHKSPSSEKIPEKNSFKDLTDSEISSSSIINKSENSIIKEDSIVILTKVKFLFIKGRK